MWEITQKGQLTDSVVSLLSGIAFSFVYMMIKSVFNPRKKLSYQNIIDVFSFVLFSGFDFCLFYSLTKGAIRYYILVIQFVGFALSYCFFSKIFAGIFVRISLTISALFSCVLYFLQTLTEKTLKISEKMLKTLKKLLKNTYRLLYTNHRKRKFEKK